ncbi:hypothetical protein E2986_11709 [Frieseomelitta varia]|uniref:Uncharacterized protein n=1 Tax=Frieseomelitta varia TaxID=561572 RepID=A0A833S051_9HYME|nr:hypothetical protein E2986_11709 [Frieseomelitta varia]
MEHNVYYTFKLLTIIFKGITISRRVYIYQTIKVGEKSYMIDWHRIPWRKSFAIPLVISMSRSTTKLTAGNIIELSISSFGDKQCTFSPLRKLKKKKKRYISCTRRLLIKTFIGVQACVLLCFLQSEFFSFFY